MKPELKQGVGIWLSFQLAAEEVERRLGLSWGAAQKTLIEACENEEVRTRAQMCSTLISGSGSTANSPNRQEVSNLAWPLTADASRFLVSTVA
jgi:hypothetical protein